MATIDKNTAVFPPTRFARIRSPHSTVLCRSPRAACARALTHFLAFSPGIEAARGPKVLLKDGSREFIHRPVPQRHSLFHRTASNSGLNCHTKHNFLSRNAKSAQISIPSAQPAQPASAASHIACQMFASMTSLDSFLLPLSTHASTRLLPPRPLGCSV